MARRVETISILDDERIERRVTLDIDTASVRQRAMRAGIFARHIHIPLAALGKGLLLDIDVRDADSRPMHMVASEVNARAAANLLLSAYEKAAGRRARKGAQFVDLAARLARNTSLDELVDLLESVESQVPPSSTSETNFEQWSEALLDDGFFDRLLALSQTYLLLVDLSLSGRIEIVKFRYVEAVVGGEGPLSLQRIGLRAVRIRVDTPGISQATRVHTRVTAPDGSSVVSVELLDGDRTIDRASYQRRVSQERASVYTRGMTDSDFALRLKIEPRIGFFLLPAAMSMWFLAMLLAFGTALQVADHRFSGSNANADAAVTILAIIPSLIAIYFVRPGEHELISRLMSVPRILVVAAALTAVLVAGAVAADVGSLATWFIVGLCACGATATYLSIVIVRVLWSRHRNRAIRR